ncbi:hypothetical protein [Pseudaestuariivita rosea]|uniref:hypothetical protein n=1 Tax=Pseudaestuariivita rosea TaxID=2763263 RepID=UPI001ABA5929|nr:hypothetical protein [Pseudaestuariivita rosea]
MKAFTVFGLVLCLAIPTVGKADSLLAQNGLRAQGNGGNQIEVFTRAGFHGRDYFCAAGDYARRKLGAGATDRVMITRAPGGSPTRPNRRSMSFELFPAGAPIDDKNSFVLSPRNVGLSRTVAHSIHLCKEGRGRRLD